MDPTLTGLAEAARLLAAGGPTLALLALLWAIHAGHLRLRREIERAEAETARLAAENEHIRAELAASRADRDALAASAAHALDAIAAGDGHAERRTPDRRAD